MLPCIVARALGVLSVVSLASAQGPGVNRPIEPTSSYQVRTIQGFRVLVSRRLLEQKGEADEVLGELGKQLEAITKVVPAEPLARLRRVPFWVERDFVPDKAAVFRPSAENLRARGRTRTRPAAWRSPTRGTSSTGHAKSSPSLPSTSWPTRTIST
jgi:hypothetical protein